MKKNSLKNSDSDLRFHPKDDFSFIYYSNLYRFKIYQFEESDFFAIEVLFVCICINCLNADINIVG